MNDPHLPARREKALSYAGLPFENVMTITKFRFLIDLGIALEAPSSRRLRDRSVVPCTSGVGGQCAGSKCEPIPRPEPKCEQKFPTERPTGPGYSTGRVGKAEGNQMAGLTEYSSNRAIR